MCECKTSCVWSVIVYKWKTTEFDGNIMTLSQDKQRKYMLLRIESKKLKKVEIVTFQRGKITGIKRKTSLRYMEGPL